MITKHEAVSRLSILAAEYEPSLFAEQLPVDLLAELREQALGLSTPGESIILRSVCEAEPVEREVRMERERAESERYAAGLKVWKAYLDSVV